jgi:hypothetical protein
MCTTFLLLLLLLLRADVWTQDVLNLGVKPDRLVALMRQKLEAAGSKVYEEVQLVRLQ